MSVVRPIETLYAGCRFRSRLEARWAVFFDRMRIPWEYEAQGFDTPAGPYLPDFVLTDCATFVEVRGDSTRVDVDALAVVADALPVLHPRTQIPYPDRSGRTWTAERGPRLMLLGPIPRVDELPARCDWGWLATSGTVTADVGGWGLWGFGMYQKNRRPWWHDTPALSQLAQPLTPVAGWEGGELSRDAYGTARAARFEHGQTPDRIPVQRAVLGARARRAAT